jgi:predicted MFS family arabinose efflux permease
MTRWIVFALGGAAFWLAFFHRVAPVSIADELTRAFAVNSAALGALAATYFYVYAVMQIPTGVLVDTLGSSRVLTAGGVAAGVGSILFGLADTFWGAAIGRTLAGLGVSVAFVALLKICAQWFEERQFATVASGVNFIGLCGALSATVPLAWLITFVSWRDVFVGIGVASLFVALLTWRLARDHASTAVHNAGARDWRADLVAVMKNRATWPPFWVSFGLSGSYMCFIGLWLAPMLTQAYGKSPLVASQHASIMIITLAISAIIMARVSDALGKRKPVLVAVAAMYIVLWAAWLIGVPGEWTFAMCALTGAAAPGFTFSWSLSKEVNPPEHAGMAISVANTGGFLAAGILQPLAGAMLDASKGVNTAGTMTDFRIAMSSLAVFAVAGFLGALFVRETRCRNIWADAIAGNTLARKTA